jgi:hypothetical protein
LCIFKSSLIYKNGESNKQNVYKHNKSMFKLIWDVFASVFESTCCLIGCFCGEECSKRKKECSKRKNTQKLGFLDSLVSAWLSDRTSTMFYHQMIIGQLFEYRTLCQLLSRLPYITLRLFVLTKMPLIRHSYPRKWRK